MYDLILADPPWHFQNFGLSEPGIVEEGSRRASTHYPTMSNEDIMSLEVDKITNKNSVLLLWACNPLLPEALAVIDAWGFSFKSLAWVWVKANPSGMGHYMGMGYWTRANSEPCYIATKGKGLPRLDKGVLSIIYSPVREHSRKPDEQYGKIERLFGTDINRLEMFARRERPGWDVFGNEVDSSIDISSKNTLS